MVDKFWNDQNLEPKRNHRFILQLGDAEAGTKIQKYHVKTSGRPTYQINDVQHKYLNHEFNFPGNVTWEDLDISFVDPIDNGSTQKVINIIQQSGYNLPSAGQEAQETVGKAKAVEALGKCLIKQIDADGNTIEQFRLQNAWISNVEWSEFDYESDDLSDISVTVTYDWAEREEGAAAGGNLPPKDGTQ